MDALRASPTAALYKRRPEKLVFFTRVLSLWALQRRSKNRARGISSSARRPKRHRTPLICCARSRALDSRALARNSTYQSSRTAAATRATPFFRRPFRRFPGLFPRGRGFVHLSLVSAGRHARQSLTNSARPPTAALAPARCSTKGPQGMYCFQLSHFCMKFGACCL